MQRRKIIRMINRYEEMLPPHTDTVEKEFHVEDDGYAVIDLNAYPGIQWFDPLSYGSQRDLHAEIYDYVDAKANEIPVMYPIRINVRNCGDQEIDCKMISSVMRKHYTMLHWESLTQLKKNKIMAAMFTVLGISMLVFAVAIQSMGALRIFSEMAMIVATFTFWEAASRWMVERAELNVNRLYTGQMAVVDIRFQKD